MKLKKYKLGDIAEIIPGYAFKASDFSFGENIAIKIKDIEPPFININNADKVNFKPNDKYRLEYSDFVLAMTGATIGKVGINNTHIPNVYINQRVCKFIPNEEVCDKSYLFYLLSTKIFKKFIYRNIDSSSAQPNIGHPSILKFEHYFPTLAEQKRIGNLLSALDQKIALNRKINDNLEAMAKQLYDYWFVQFDFPNEEGKPYKSSGGKMVWNEKLKRDIPEGWEVGVFSDIANITMGQSPDGSSYNDKGNGEIFYQGSTDFGIRFPSIRMYTTAPIRFAKKGDILMSVRAPVGTVNIANTDCCIGRGLSAINSKIDSITYIYFVIHYLKIKFDTLNYSGTTFGSITKDDLNNLPALIPHINIINSFESITKPIFDKQMLIGFEIASLTKQRDELLPLLMNGQVSVNYD